MTRMNFLLLPGPKVAFVLGIILSQSIQTLVTAEHSSHSHHHLHSVNNHGPLHPTAEQPFGGPLAPGLQVTGGSKLRRAKSKLTRRAKAFQTGTIQQSQQLQFQTQPAVIRTQLSSSDVQTNPEAEINEVSNTQATEIVIQEIKPAFITPPPPPPPAAAVATATPTTDSIPRQAIFYMSLLAIQFGVQPILVKKFAPRGICKSSVVLTQELVKGVIAFGAYMGSTRPDVRSRELASLSVPSWLTMAGVPAAIYTIQNLASLLAYQNLEALAFNVLNQTKILSAALCCYLVMGKKQTKRQSFSLVLLLTSALVIEGVISTSSIRSILAGLTSGSTLPNPMNMGRRFTHGVVPLLLASFLSGLAGALTQKNLQGVATKKSASGSKGGSNKPKNPYLFSMELTAASVVVLLASLLVSADGRQIRQNGFFHLWTLETMIPIMTNSLGGILVGLVTKHAGSVRKGFALIFGILLSGIFQAGSVGGISSAQIGGGILAATSLWLHASSSGAPQVATNTIKEKTS